MVRRVRPPHLPRFRYNPSCLFNCKSKHKLKAHYAYQKRTEE